jgi:hypothetical protein
MTVMMLVHSMHQLCMGVESRLINWRQLKEYIPNKGWLKELQTLHVKNDVIKTLKCVPSSLRGPDLLQGIHNIERLLMTNVGRWKTNRSRSLLNRIWKCAIIQWRSKGRC